MYSLSTQRDLVMLDNEVRQKQAGVVEELGFQALADLVRTGDIGIPEAGRMIVPLEDVNLWKKDTILELVVKAEEDASPLA